MASFYIVPIVVLMFGIYAQSAIIDTDVPEPEIGSGSPLIPSIDDIRLCEENAKGRLFILSYKLPLETCLPRCVYDNEKTEQIKAVDGQLCCDTVGVGPTGLCKDGVCLLGGVADISTKKALDTLKDKFGK